MNNFLEKYFMIKAIIIENNDQPVGFITKTVELYIPNVSIVSQAKDVKSGIGVINDHDHDQGFHGIHKSHIVNINRMSYFDKANGGILVMCNGDKVPVASRKKEILMELFDGLS